MSQSPSYSPVLNTIDRHYKDLTEDPDPIINPFYYAQDRDSWYTEEAAKACAENRQTNKVEKKMKKINKKKSFKNKSFIMRKEPGNVRQLIKIIVYDLDGRPTNEIDTDPDSASVNIQYLVRSDYDDIMGETEQLVGKIVKKLSSTL